MDEELKPCPFCGGRFQLFKDNYKKYGAYCLRCGMYLGITLESGVEFHDGWNAQFDSVEALTDAINHRAVPENETLTLEQLRQMDGDPVWVKEITKEPIDGDYWGIVDIDTVCVGGYGIGAVISPATNGKSLFAQTPFSDYGKTWLAHRCKPGKEKSAPGRQSEERK